MSLYRLKDVAQKIYSTGMVQVFTKLVLQAIIDTRKVVLKNIKKNQPQFCSNIYSLSISFLTVSHRKITCAYFKVNMNWKSVINDVTIYCLHNLSMLQSVLVS